ncbi:MAG: TIGR02147 family protein [Deltaproteobacteria bacterium]|nr:TIGR02147 family protein [Deltaproteobacteria bacterium]
MEKGQKEIDIFRYRDYHIFLKDWYEQAKRTRRSFSFRALSNKAGFRSKNFPLLVMQGKRNLSEESMARFVSALNMDRRQEEFFRDLVRFNQAKTHEEKNRHYRLLLEFKMAGLRKRLEKEKYDYYSEWYHPVVRELITSEEFDGTPGWIATKISPSITPAQAAKSIRLLEKLELIRKIGENRWAPSEAVIDTGPEIDSVIVHNYHKKLLDLTKERMESLNLEYRDTSAMTLGVRRETVHKIKQRVQEFRQEILRLVSGDKNTEEVIQLNIHFYPVTNISAKEREGV